jgi:tricorn protease
MRLLALFAAFSVAATAWSKPLRYPDIHGDHVVFSHTGDLYVASTKTGETRRLTSHEGQELFAKFSPDGKHIAFSGEYQGTRQIYVIPVEGGTPKQLTFYNDVGPMPPRGGFDYQVLDWHPDGKHILFRGNRLPWGPRMGKYFKVSIEGGLEEALEIPEAGSGSYSPDGKKIVYTPVAREFRTWKRYRGGRAQDVWVYDLENSTSEALTTHIMTDALPVWTGNGIYFISDRTGTLNLFKVDPASKEVSQVTDHKDFDVWWPSAGGDKVVYEHGGNLRVFDTASGSDSAI